MNNLNEKNKTWEEHTHDLVSNTQKNKGNKDARALLAVLVAAFLNTSDLPATEAQKRSRMLVDLINTTSIEVARIVFDDPMEVMEAFLYREGYVKCQREDKDGYFWKRFDFVVARS